MLPEEYNILAKATGLRPCHFLWQCDDRKIVILGNTTNTVKHDTIWTSDLPDDCSLAKWAAVIHEERLHPEKQILWDEAYAAQHNEVVKRRQFARHIGNLLNEQMDSHSLTQTTLVRYAEAYLYYWPKSDYYPSDVRPLALSILKDHHYKKENHQPLFAGKVDLKRLIIHCLADHLLEEFNDNEKGWKIDHLIEDEYVDEFQEIKGEYGHIDMYQVKQIAAPPPQRFWYMEPKVL